MTASISASASPVLLSTQMTSVPLIPMSPFSDRMKVVTKARGTSVSGGSIIWAAVGGRSTAAYSSSSAVGQMNQELLNAQAQNEAARQQAQTGGSSGAGLTGAEAELIKSQKDGMELIKIQIAMQRENQMFTMISNILKIRHETLKTIIGNIR